MNAKDLNLAYFVKEAMTKKKSLKTATTGTNVIKLFTAVIYNCSQYASVFIPGRPFQPRLMFSCKARANQSETP